ncbi:MAG: hydroxylamine reductase [Candidatus Omnitrophica bacterium]|nr:hydroxylamine reductase [Candidatus Omnitrophota bacterium]MDD5488554.1 hydroxylamine reductase [Candidatus Omnitrophota bacterium]
MFCRQCEQTAAGKGCTIKGVCGKEDRVAILQDLLIFGLKGISIYAHAARSSGIKDPGTDRFVIEALFTTVTNVNFSEKSIAEMIKKAGEVYDRIKRMAGKEGVPEKYASWAPAEDLDELVEQGVKTGILSDPAPNEDIRSLREILLYGLKGMAAYADHAAILGMENDEVNGFFHKGLAALTDDELGVEDLLALIMEFGKVNLTCMETLDKAHTLTFGDPVPTKVSLGLRKGPAILVSGHDLKDLKQLLEQTEGKGVSVYTHGEMLPAHGYPRLKEHDHLAGHYGGAWQDQKKEFDIFPGAILMTTNCVQKPADTYAGRLFTTGLVEWPGVGHIAADENGDKDFSVLIEKALATVGSQGEVKGKEITVGFAHKAVLGVAGKIVEMVKNGSIKHFFLIGGCDGAKTGRNYYTELAEKVPLDCIILTLACGKFRFNRLEFGEIGGIPRLLDCGQCNDAYSAIKIAVTLAEAFKCGVNDLPLSLVLSWYEQKAVCILLTLLSLGIKDIRLGPTLPAFISSNVLKVLVEKFGIRPITTPDQDLADML